MDETFQELRDPQLNEIRTRFLTWSGVSLPMLGALVDPEAVFFYDSKALQVLFAVIGKAGMQCRVWTSLDDDDRVPNEDENRALLSAVHHLRSSAPNEPLLLGALHAKWKDTIASLPSTLTYKPYRVWIQPEDLREKQPPDPPDGFVFRTGQGNDCENMHEYSEVVRTADYYRTLYEQTSCLARIDNPAKAVAWAISQTDQALSTGGVLPEYRGRGLATLVWRHRQYDNYAHVFQAPAYVYVSDENKASIGVCKKLRMEPAWVVHWVLLPALRSAKF